MSPHKHPQTSPQPEPIKTLQVTWSSGNETFDLIKIEHALKDATPVPFATMEIRYEGDLLVQYQPLLKRVSDDAFTLTYNDPGIWLTADAEGDPADGDLGVATYRRKNGGEGTDAWSCSWKPFDDSLPSARPKCQVVDPEMARLYAVCFRSVRDRAFRKVIFGPSPSCAITGETNKHVLEAAHILQVRDDGQDTRNNGIVLRKDLHALFDAHILRIDDKGVFKMHPVLDSYKDLFPLPHGLAKERVKVTTLLENIKARNALIADRD